MDIIHVAMIDLDGVFALDLLSRIAAINRLTGTIEFYNRKSEESEKGRISSGVFDVFSGFKKKIMGEKDKKMLEDGKIELGEIYGGAGSESFDGVNPVQRKAKKVGYAVGNKFKGMKEPERLTEVDIARIGPPPTPTTFTTLAGGAQSDASPRFLSNEELSRMGPPPEEEDDRL